MLRWMTLLRPDAGIRPYAETEAAPEIAGLEARLERLAEEYAVEGLWSREDYRRLRTGLEAKLADAQRKAAQEVEARPAKVGRVAIGLRTWWETATLEQRRALVLETVERVVVDPVGRGYRGATDARNAHLAFTERGNEALSGLTFEHGDDEATAA